MALIKCSECGKEISDKAKACPNCGFPMAENKEPQEVEMVNYEKANTNMLKKVVGIILFLIGLGVMISVTIAGEVTLY